LEVGVCWSLIVTPILRGKGAALSGATVVHVLHRVCKEAGLPRIRVHDLRHLFATILGEAALSDPVRMAVMGHASREMTDRHTHAAPTSADAAEAIDAYFGLAVPWWRPLRLVEGESRGDVP
jgi:integrase